MRNKDIELRLNDQLNRTFGSFVKLPQKIKKGENYYDLLVQAKAIAGGATKIANKLIPKLIYKKLQQKLNRLIKEFNKDETHCNVFKELKELAKTMNAIERAKRLNWLNKHFPNS